MNYNKTLDEFENALLKKMLAGCKNAESIYKMFTRKEEKQQAFLDELPF